MDRYYQQYSYSYSYSYRYRCKGGWSAVIERVHDDFWTESRHPLSFIVEQTEILQSSGHVIYPSIASTRVSLALQVLYVGTVVVCTLNSARCSRRRSFEMLKRALRSRSLLFLHSNSTVSRIVESPRRKCRRCLVYGQERSTNVSIGGKIGVKGSQHEGLGCPTCNGSSLGRPVDAFFFATTLLVRVEALSCSCQEINARSLL
jgi:hypothetical protein